MSNTVIAKSFYKDPNALKDYGFDWTDFLNGDTISNSEWFVPDDVYVDQELYDDTQTVIWIKDGLLGQRYILTNRVTTLQGRVDERSLLIIIRDE